MKKNPE